MRPLRVGSGSAEPPPLVVSAAASGYARSACMTDAVNISTFLALSSNFWYWRLRAQPRPRTATFLRAHLGLRCRERRTVGGKTMRVDSLQGCV